MRVHACPRHLVIKRHKHPARAILVSQFLVCPLVRHGRLYYIVTIFAMRIEHGWMEWMDGQISAEHIRCPYPSIYVVEYPPCMGPPCPKTGAQNKSCASRASSARHSWPLPPRFSWSITRSKVLYVYNMMCAWMSRKGERERVGGKRHRQSERERETGRE